MHGFKEGSKFEICETDIQSLQTQVRGILRIDELGTVTSTLAFDGDRFDVPSQFYAKQIDTVTTEKLKVYTPDSTWINTILSESSETAATLGVALVDSISDADISLTVNGMRFTVTHHDPFVTQHFGQRPVWSTGHPEQLKRVLEAASNFYSLLRRIPQCRVGIEVPQHSILK